MFGVRRGRTISVRIAAVCREAGLGEGFSGHSPRVGMTQDLTANGAGLVAIMNAGRWKSERMPAHYSTGRSGGAWGRCPFTTPGRAENDRNLTMVENPTFSSPRPGDRMSMADSNLEGNETSGTDLAMSRGQHPRDAGRLNYPFPRRKRNGKI